MAKHFDFEEGSIQFKRYRNGQIAMQHYNNKGIPNATLTVAVDNCPLSDKEVLIKDWSENDGVLHDLIKHEIVSKPVREVVSGYASIHVCRLLVDGTSGNVLKIQTHSKKQQADEQVY